MDDPTAAFLNDPIGVFGYLATVLGLVFWASRRRWLKRFFSVVPPIILAYFIPTLSTTAGSPRWILPPMSGCGLTCCL